MSISLFELATYLDEFLDPHKIQEAAYNGIQVAHTGPIEKIATAVSASLETIEKAAALDTQALIVHHGIFRKNDPHVLIGTNYQKIKILLKHNIALLSYHLPLDAHQKIGNNWKAARDLGLQDCKPFAYLDSLPIGVIGTIPSTAFDAFKKKVELYYNRSADAVKIKDPIKSVAIISGGAEKFITAASYAGADCFITGRVDEPVWDNAHEANISFLGLGHYHTETVGPQALAHHIEGVFNTPCVFIKTDNPF